jgi:hypothetical protein
MDGQLGVLVAGGVPPSLFLHLGRPPLTLGLDLAFVNYDEGFV